MNLFYLRQYKKTLCFIVVFCCAWAFAQTRDLGFAGRDGRAGAKGSDGLNGESMIIQAGSLSQSYDVSGTDGQSGGDGHPATDASSCNWLPHDELPRHNLRGARGGHGGAGGAGGKGGHGGDVLILYENEAQLKNIQIRSLGGRGAMGGLGATAGRACSCPLSTWQQQSWETRWYDEIRCHYSYETAPAQPAPSTPLARASKLSTVSKLQDVSQTDLKSQSLTEASTSAALHTYVQSTCVRRLRDTGLCVEWASHPGQRCRRWDYRGQCVDWWRERHPALPPHAVCVRWNYARSCTEWSVTELGRRCVRRFLGICVEFVADPTVIRKGVCRYQSVPYNELVTRTYHCTRGDDGRMGREGRRGDDGRKGQISLVPRADVPEVDRPSAGLSMAELQDTVLKLSKNHWQTQHGAVALLAPASVVRDDYRLFIKRVEKRVRFQWLAHERPASDFKKHRVSVWLDNNFEVKFKFPPQVWLDYEVSREAGTTLVRIKHAIFSHDLKRVRPVDILGTGYDTVLEIEDSLGAGEFVDTQVYLETKWRQLDGKRYKQWVPDEFVERTADLVRVHIGQLPIKHKYLKPNHKLHLELTLKRSTVFGQTLVGEWKIKKHLGTLTPIQIKHSDIDKRL